MAQDMRKDDTILQKSEDFAVRIINMCKHLRRESNAYVLSKQVLRSGTSIGANVADAQRAQSKADFIAKMSIALKETNETFYWLRLLYRTEYLTREAFDSMLRDTEELLRILTAICKTAAASAKK